MNDDPTEQAMPLEDSLPQSRIEQRVAQVCKEIAARSTTGGTVDPEQGAGELLEAFTGSDRGH